MNDRLRTILGWGAVLSIEALSLGVGVALCIRGTVPWYAVPFFLAIPPAVAVVLCFAGLANAEANGENPFQ